MTASLRGLLQQLLMKHEQAHKSQNPWVGFVPAHGATCTCGEAPATTEGAWGFPECLGISFWQVWRPQMQNRCKPRPGHSFCCPLTGAEVYVPLSPSSKHTYPMPQKASFLPVVQERDKSATWPCYVTSHMLGDDKWHLDYHFTFPQG